jgi:hypothetical protein
MECKKIQELLLTDYIDGEAGDALKNEVERHVNICHTCRQFKQSLLKIAIEPFRKAKESKPPDLAWNRIKEAIVKEAIVKEALIKDALVKDALIKETIVLEERGKPGGFLAQLRNYLPHAPGGRTLFSVPKPALALAAGLGAVVVLIFTVSRLQPNNQRVAKVYSEKQVEYLTHVIGDSEYFSLEESNGYDTAIEEYFF